MKVQNNKSPKIIMKTSPKDFVINSTNKLDPKIEGKKLNFTWKVKGQVISTDAVLLLNTDISEYLEITLDVTSIYGKDSFVYEINILDKPIVKIISKSSIEYKLETGRKDVKFVRWTVGDKVFNSMKTSIFFKEKPKNKVLAHIFFPESVVDVGVNGVVLIPELPIEPVVEPIIEDIENESEVESEVAPIIEEIGAIEPVVEPEIKPKRKYKKRIK